MQIFKIRRKYAHSYCPTSVFIADYSQTSIIYFEAEI